MENKKDMTVEYVNKLACINGGSISEEAYTLIMELKNDKITTEDAVQLIIMKYKGE